MKYTQSYQTINAPEPYTPDDYLADMFNGDTYSSPLDLCAAIADRGGEFEELVTMLEAYADAHPDDHTFWNAVRDLKTEDERRAHHIKMGTYAE